VDFFLRRPRSATAVAGDEACTVNVVPRSAFDVLRQKSPEVLPLCYTCICTLARCLAVMLETIQRLL